MTSQAVAECGSTGVVEPAGGPSSSGAGDQPGIDRCALLSDGQLEVLRLVNRHLNSKEIASTLGISSHTVDQRVRTAIRRLGVSRRSEAARLVDTYDRQQGIAADAAERPALFPYQQLIHQSPHIDAGPTADETDGAVSFQIRHADRTGGGRGSQPRNRAEVGQPTLLVTSVVDTTPTPQLVERGTAADRDHRHRDRSQFLGRDVPRGPRKLGQAGASLTR